MAGLPSEETILTLDSIHKYHTIHTNLRSTYGSKWEPWEAFRELVQNWRDGIIKSFNLNEKDFHVIREEKSQYEILYKVPARPETQPAQYLGYIRFTGKVGGGRVELVNRKATIQPSNFDLGGTTKLRDRGQAGEHGDGLKVALLVLMRAPHNHSVRFDTGGFRWEPNFDKQNKLVINMSRLQDFDITADERLSKTDLQDGLVPLLAMPRDDVKLIIGLGNSVKAQDFKEWTKAALFLHDIKNGDIISVAQGDLITSPALRRNIYLKGLLLKPSKSRGATGEGSASITGKALNFGYNFAHGNTNRDRQSLAGGYDEAKAIFAIWEDVLRQKPELVSELHSMLNTRNPEYADVSQARTFLSAEVVNRLKTYLFSKPFEKRWYHARSEKDEDHHLARNIRSLGRVPYILEETYWDILESKGHVRTAAAEKRIRFLKQSEKDVPDTSFSHEVYWYLRACLKSCVQTQNTRLLCVEGVGLDPTTMWEEAKDLVRIHKSWFLEDKAADELGLPVTEDTFTLISSTVMEVFRSVIHQIPGGRFDRYMDSHSQRWHKTRAIYQVQKYLFDCIQVKRRLKLSISGPSHDPELVVSWTPDAGWKPDRDLLRIEVHQVSKCAHFKKELLAGQYSSIRKPCFLNKGTRPSLGLPICQKVDGHLYRSSDDEVTFSGLREGEEYFAVIYNSSERHSFIVVSDSTVVMPKATAPPQPSPPQSPVPKKRTYTLGDERENLDIMKHRKWYDASNDEGQEAVVGIPPEDAPETSAQKTPAKRSAPQTPATKRARRS
ncbi:hypothetical protein PG985_015578 [Apiospora marii]|uniref:Uncharacterized protein n=1 Tax=Apiospora marii TaxID=335849 RepID=A0ABR1S5G1_9PEZI